jgi:adenylate cyclase class 2
MPNEIEIKFRVADVQELEHRLQSAGFQCITARTHEMNTLYDTADLALRRAGELLRIRQYGNGWTLTHKSRGATGRHKNRVELETRVEDGESLDAIVRALGYSPSFRYEKFRAEWTDGRGHVVIDETPIGNFAEVEGEPDWIDVTAHRLGVTESDYITQNYAALFFAWKHETGSPASEMTFSAVGTPRDDA